MNATIFIRNLVQRDSVISVCIAKVLSDGLYIIWTYLYLHFTAPVVVITTSSLQHVLYNSLGTRLSLADPPEGDKLKILNEVWKFITKLKEPAVRFLSACLTYPMSLVLFYIIHSCVCVCAFFFFFFLYTRSTAGQCS